jgi:hypothetical protein
MRGLLILGVVLVIAGIGALVVDVIPVHHTEQVAKIGPIVASKDTETDYFIPTWAGIAIIVLGGGLIFAGARKA